jgi:capsular exopolysaccharide synthesis family protein
VSKFFEGTQRAAGVTTDPAVDLQFGPNRSTLQQQTERSVEAEDDYGERSGAMRPDDVLLRPSDAFIIETEAQAAGAEGLAEEPVPGAPGDTEETDAGSRAHRTTVSVDRAVEDAALHPAYERIIQKLLAFRSTPRRSVVLFASATSGEGVSTIARNTALALGRHKKERVLLLDANVRTPSQHLAFDCAREGGLSDVIEGSATIAAAVKSNLGSRLFLLTAGRPVASAQHMLAESVLQGIAMALTSLFDWVIIDGPPVTVYPEAASLAAVSGGAVLVVRAERTRREVVEESKKILGESRVDVIGAVLNRRKYYIPGFIYRRL